MAKLIDPRLRIIEQGLHPHPGPPKKMRGKVATKTSNQSEKHGSTPTAILLDSLCEDDGDKGKGHGREEAHGREGDGHENGRGRSTDRTASFRTRLRSKGPLERGTVSVEGGERRTKRRLMSKLPPNELHSTASTDTTDGPKSTHWPMHGQRDSKPKLSTHWPMHGQRDSRVREGGQIPDGRIGAAGPRQHNQDTQARLQAPSAPSAASADLMPDVLTDESRNERPRRLRQKTKQRPSDQTHDKEVHKVATHASPKIEVHPPRHKRSRLTQDEKAQLIELEVMKMRQDRVSHAPHAPSMDDALMIDDDLTKTSKVLKEISKVKKKHFTKIPPSTKVILSWISHSVVLANLPSRPISTSTLRTSNPPRQHK